MAALPTLAPRPARGAQWIGRCDCGWSGSAHTDPEAATEQALRHARSATEKGSDDE